LSKYKPLIIDSGTGKRSEHTAIHLLLRDSYLIAEGVAVFLEASVAFANEDVDGKRLLDVGCVGEGHNDGRGRKPVADIVLDDNAGPGLPLFMPDHGIESDLDDQSPERLADRQKPSRSTWANSSRTLRFNAELAT